MLVELMGHGSLIVVGTGIQMVGQVTLEAKACIERADKVLFTVANPGTVRWLCSLNPNAEALPYDRSLRRRKHAYAAIVERILVDVRAGNNVCAVFYGHPGVLTDPAHGAIRQAHREGHAARMLPGISAEACLFADLGVDPGKLGWQSFEVTDFLIRRRKFDSGCALILWQLAQIGELGFRSGDTSRNLRVLVETLAEHYERNHEVVVYEAAVYPVCQPSIQRARLAELDAVQLSEVSTLYVPPDGSQVIDRAMLARLGMEEHNEW